MESSFFQHINSSNKRKLDQEDELHTLENHENKVLKQNEIHASSATCIELGKQKNIKLNSLQEEQQYTKTPFSNEVNENRHQETHTENSSTHSASSDLNDPYQGNHDNEYEDNEEEDEFIPPLARYILDHVDNLTEELKTAVQEDTRHLGFWGFLNKYSAIPFKVLLKIFDVDMEDDIEISPEEAIPILRFAMNRKIGKRQKREDVNTIEQVVELFRKSKNIIVLTGAGVSVSCGIPDFRSKNGIYSRLGEFDLEDPQQMFDLDYFKYNPATFYSFAKEIYPSNFKPSLSHKFIKLLQDKRKLLRNYTQNIDTIEQITGITKLVQCHGSFASASCIECKRKVNIKDIEKDIFAQTVPICLKCSDEVDGIIKPDITFFGEKLPDHFDESFKEDKDKVDLLIVMGSSLKVSPVADVKDKIPHHVPQILINMESLPHVSGFDVQLLGKCDVIVQELCNMLEWKLDLSDTCVGTDLKNDENLNIVSDDENQTSEAKDPHEPFQFVPPNVYLFEGAKIYEDTDTDDMIDEDEDHDNDSVASILNDIEQDADEELGLASLYE